MALEIQKQNKTGLPASLKQVKTKLEPQKSKTPVDEGTLMSKR
jgi:hypothetical protein